MINWKEMKKVDFIVIHAAATPPDMDIGAEEIKGWHLQKGWLDIGYHKVIRRDGTTEDGRSLDVPGAHARGYNGRSWGICLVGGVDWRNKPENNFTPAQWRELELQVRKMKFDQPNAKVLGHRDLPNVNKACPCFDAITWWENLNTTTDPGYCPVKQN